MPTASMFSVIPPFLKEEKNDGPTCRPMQNTNKIKPNSRMKCKMCISPVNPKCPIRIPVKRTNVTPSDTPKTLILPSSTLNQQEFIKRQIQAEKIKLRRVKEAYENGVDTLEAVSYTHLDVYKRQILGMR